MNSRLLTCHRRSFLKIASGALLVAGAPAIVRAAPPLDRIEGHAFGTQWTVAHPAAAGHDRLRSRLVGLLEEIDFAFSPWRADGVLGRFNAGLTDETTATDEIVDVTRAALAIAEESGGSFDPTVGPLVGRWGFGPIHRGHVREQGWRAIEAKDRHIARRYPGLTLDLCGIAKGHALDRMTGLLLDEGIDDFIVDFGGELAARGRHPSGRAWRVGIEDPRGNAEGPVAAVALEGLAIATSGDRSNGYDVGGRRYSHIIDPATREPAEGKLASVSVMMPTARDADGWATALMALGEKGPALATDRAIDALFLFRDGERLRHEATGSIAGRLL